LNYARGGTAYTGHPAAC